MRSQSDPTLVPWVRSEVRATAYELRAAIERLRAGQNLLPLPPEDVLQTVYESETGLQRFPVVDLHGDLDQLVTETLPDAVALMERAAGVLP